MPDMDPIVPRMITMVLFCQHAAHRVALALWRTLERGLAQVLHLVPGQKRRELAALRTHAVDQEQREQEVEVRARQHEIEAQIVLESMLSDPQEWRTQLEVKAREFRQHIWEARQFLMNPTLSQEERAQTEDLIKEMERGVSDFELRLRLSQEARAQVEARTREAESKAKHDSSLF